MLKDGNRLPHLRLPPPPYIISACDDCNSAVAEMRAQEASGQERMSDVGPWLKKRRRLISIVNRLRELAGEIRFEGAVLGGLTTACNDKI